MKNGMNQSMMHHLIVFQSPFAVHRVVSRSMLGYTAVLSKHKDTRFWNLAHLCRAGGLRVLFYNMCSHKPCQAHPCLR